MSIPDKDAATPNGAKAPITFESRVNEVVGAMTQDDKGGWVLPEGDHDEAIIYAANAERRRRDTQSAYTKTNQEKARLEAENRLLADAWSNDFATQLDTKTQMELEELKMTDPDAWRIKLNEIEQQRKASFQETRTSIQQKAQGETELEYRQRALADFTAANPDLQLNDDVIKFDLPPRLTMQLEKGEVSFGEFLNQAKTYLTKSRVVAPTGDKPTPEKDLGVTAGSDRPADDSVSRALANQYNEEIY